MNRIIPTILGLTIGALGGALLLDVHHAYGQSQLIKAYEQYYSGTETLLDELDSAYNWVDGYDNWEYYEAKARIDSLTNQ